MRRRGSSRDRTGGALERAREFFFPGRGRCLERAGGGPGRTTGGMRRQRPDPIARRQQNSKTQKVMLGENRVARAERERKQSTGGARGGVSKDKERERGVGPVECVRSRREVKNWERRARRVEKSENLPVQVDACGLVDRWGRPSQGQPGGCGKADGIASAAQQRVGTSGEWWAGAGQTLLRIWQGREPDSPVAAVTWVAARGVHCAYCVYLSCPLLASGPAPQLISRQKPKPQGRAHGMGQLTPPRLP